MSWYKIEATATRIVYYILAYVFIWLEVTDELFSHVSRRFSDPKSQSRLTEDFFF